MAYTFNAAAKLVQCSVDTTEIVLADLWSRWKDWVLEGNAEVEPAFDTIGGDIPAIPLYLFPINNWKIKLPEADSTVRITGGILATADDSDPFVNPTGDYVVRVEREAPAIAVGYETAGGGGGGNAPSAEQVATAVWAAPERTLTSGGGGGGGGDLDAEMAALVALVTQGAQIFMNNAGQP